MIPQPAAKATLKLSTIAIPFPLTLTGFLAFGFTQEDVSPGTGHPTLVVTANS
jgi:hypothetical protein